MHKALLFQPYYTVFEDIRSYDSVMGKILQGKVYKYRWNQSYVDKFLPGYISLSITIDIFKEHNSQQIETMKANS